MAIGAAPAWPLGCAPPRADPVLAPPATRSHTATPNAAAGAGTCGRVGQGAAPASAGRAHAVDPRTTFAPMRAPASVGRTTTAGTSTKAPISCV